MFPVQGLHALFQVDVEVLVGVVVVHVLGHVELHAIHQIHQLHKHAQLHLYIEVRLEAHQLLDPAGQGVDAAGAGVDGVDLLDVPPLVNHGVPWDGHDAHVLLLGVVGDHHEGVGVAVVHVRAHQEEGVHALPPVAGDGGHVAGVAVIGVELVVRGTRGSRVVRVLHRVLLGGLDCCFGLVLGEGRGLDPRPQGEPCGQGDHRDAAHHGHQNFALPAVPEVSPAVTQTPPGFPGLLGRSALPDAPCRSGVLRKRICRGGGGGGKGVRILARCLAVGGLLGTGGLPSSFITHILSVLSG